MTEAAATDSARRDRPTLLVLASTYPRRRDDHEPGFVHELARRLLDEFRVVVVTSRSPGASAHESLDGVEVFRYAYAPRKFETLVYGGGIATHLRRSPWKWLLVPGFIFSQFLAALRVVRSHRVELVHAHWLLPQGGIAWLLRRMGRGPGYAVTSHGGDLYGFRGRLAERIKRRVAADSSAMSVVSHAMRDELARLDFHPPRCEVIPMGVDLRERFVPDPQVRRDENEILFVGRLVEKKGVQQLLDAMPRVLRAAPDAFLTIAGFGPLQKELEERAHSLGITSRVRFLGAIPQTDLPALYRRAAVLVAPFQRTASGDQEGLPVVLMEAIGCGCPVIAGDVPGVRELLGEGADDLCVPQNDVAMLAEAIGRTLSAPASALDRAARIRAACAQWIDWEPVTTAYAMLLKGAMDSRSVRG